MQKTSNLAQPDTVASVSKEVEKPPILRGQTLRSKFQKMRKTSNFAQAGTVASVSKDAEKLKKSLRRTLWPQF
jgi:hypothetical protein